MPISCGAWRRTARRLRRSRARWRSSRCRRGREPCSACTRLTTSYEQLAALLAAADSPDWLVQYHVATGLTRLALETLEPDADLAATAKRALARVRARGRPPHALMSARLDGSSGADDTWPLATIRKARTLAPGRADYALVESCILTRRGEYIAARELLTPLTGPRFSDNVRAPPAVDRRDRSARAGHARLPCRARRATPVIVIVECCGDSGREATTPFRKVADGERRVEGLLERMDCRGDRIVLDVRSAGRLEQFAAPAAGVEFISYRPDLAGGTAGGAQASRPRLRHRPRRRRHSAYRRDRIPEMTACAQPGAAAVRYSAPTPRYVRSFSSSNFDSPTARVRGTRRRSPRQTRPAWRQSPGYAKERSRAVVEDVDPPSG